MAVNIADSIGYGKTGPDDETTGSIYQEEWAQLIPNAGGREYGVIGAGAWQVTVGAADREIAIAPGPGYGHGVVDKTAAEARLVLPPSASGSTWHLIVVHRDWQTRQSSFDSIQGGSTATALPDRDNVPGTVDDQPIALVRVQAGQSQVAEIRDLRVWGGDGGAYASDELVLQYLRRVGTRLRVGKADWERVLNALGQPVWVGGLPQTSLQNTVSAGAIIGLGSEGQVGGFTPAAGKRQVRVFCSVQLWLPSGSYAGTLRLLRGDTALAARRWHSHGRSEQWFFPSFEYVDAPAGGIPQDSPMRVMVSLDGTSSGGVELWDAYVNWVAE